MTQLTQIILTFPVVIKTHCSMRCGMFLPFFHELIEVFFHVLKDKVEVVILSDDFFQFYHIGMV